MKLAYTMSPKRGETDIHLTDLASQLTAKGWDLGGVVQINSEHCDGHLCDMDVRVLPSGPDIRISQSLGKEAKGCRLDTGALEQATGLVTARLEAGADLLIINKFGKHEAEGRGFRDVIGVALARGIPVIVGVNKLNYEAFLTFSDGLATPIEPNIDAVLDWASATQKMHA